MEYHQGIKKYNLNELEKLYIEIQETIKDTGLKVKTTLLDPKKQNRVKIEKTNTKEFMTIWHNGDTFEILDKLIMYEDTHEKITKEEILTRIKEII